tara:strand:+ start:67 stop:492 length:426 start_codon:yes stop_codon:yes gene_type:complete
MAYAKHITDQLAINAKLDKTILVPITPDDANHLFVALDSHIDGLREADQSEGTYQELLSEAEATRKKLQDVLTVQANTQVEVINSLAKVYQDWCTMNGLPQLSMDEHDVDSMTPLQVKELYRFYELWELANLDINGRKEIR